MKPNFRTELVKVDPIGGAAFLGLTGKRHPSTLRGKDHMVTLSRMKPLLAQVVCRSCVSQAGHHLSSLRRVCPLRL